MKKEQAFFFILETTNAAKKQMGTDDRLDRFANARSNRVRWSK
jgi:hypothetical protein